MNRTRTGFSLAALAALILSLLQIVPLASAQDQDYDQDPPTRAGRLGYVQGAVSFQPQGQGDWVDAVPNRPLTTGDNLWADRDSRAEVQIGSTAVRLSSETSVTFLDLDNDVTQLRLSTGSLFLRVRHLRDGETFEVDTPNLAFNVYQPGEYRIDVNEDGDQTSASVWRGDAEITGGGNSYRLQEGQRGTFSGVDQLAYDVGGIGQEDAFDVWCRGRNDRQDRVRSSRYVSDEMTGYEDLDDYGRWHNVSGYGDVWTPSGVAGGWAPYRYGHWAY
ncbi:MAG TPA: FecR domain-containing protein, partial [Terriglobales bacterium]|nr:FecR domain-containing protein [Terriglobales bacterium]